MAAATGVTACCWSCAALYAPLTIAGPGSREASHTIADLILVGTLHGTGYRAWALAAYASTAGMCAVSATASLTSTGIRAGRLIIAAVCTLIWCAPALLAADAPSRPGPAAYVAAAGFVFTLAGVVLQATPVPALRRANNRSTPVQETT